MASTMLKTRYTIIAFLFSTVLFWQSLSAAPETNKPTRLYGRVEKVAGGEDPRLPDDLQNTMQQGGFRFEAHAEQSASLPESLKGQWDGKVVISQMQTYPHLHPEPYCQQFIKEIGQQFSLGKSGRITLAFHNIGNGKVTVASSDIWFAHGLKVMLTCNVTPALVRGGTNLPRPVRNDVTTLGADRIEQTRIDYVQIVNRYRQLIHTGFTEVSALYHIKAPKRMYIKILNVDYDAQGKPLWKVLMEGEAIRWSSH